MPVKRSHVMAKLTKESCKKRDMSHLAIRLINREVRFNPPRTSKELFNGAGVPRVPKTQYTIFSKDSPNVAK